MFYSVKMMSRIGRLSQYMFYSVKMMSRIGKVGIVKICSTVSR